MRHKIYRVSALFSLIAFSFHGCVKTEKHMGCLREANFQEDKAAVYCNPVRPSSPLSLDEMVEIALHRNFFLKVKEWECAVQREAATRVKWTMLPELLAFGELNRRDSIPGVSSESLEPGVPPAPPSISTEQHTARHDVTLTWDLLDFGLSYYRAHQEANRILIQKFEYEKVKQTVTLDIARNYWNAVAAKKAMEKTEELINRERGYQLSLIKMAKSSLVPISRVYETHSQLLDEELKLQEFTRQYHFALIELSRLMGLPPGTEFDIYVDGTRTIDVELPDTRELEELALLHRPELMTHDVQEKIDVDEVRIAVLETIPGVSVFGISSYNDNKFLLHNYWLTIGARAVWDLFSVPTGISYQRLAKKQLQLTKQNRLALAMGAVSQVHLAHLIYHDDMESYLLASEAESIKKTLLTSATKKKVAGKYDGTDVLIYNSDSCHAEIQAWKAYADMQYSLEQLNNSMGLPLYYKNGKNTPSSQEETF